MATTSIWQGAAVLMLASLLNRILSFGYRMLVVRYIGAEGMGLYEMVFPFYSLVLMVATAGVPVALAKLTAERVALGQWGKVRSVFRLSLLFLTASGLLASLVLWRLAPVLTGRMFADSRVYQAFMVMLLALPVVCVCSAFRGYFQGWQLMRPVALAQVIEQFVRVSAGLFLGIYLLPYGVAMAAAGLAAGMVLGEVAGLGISMLIFNMARPYHDLAVGQASSLRVDILPLTRLAIPVMLARVAGGIMLTLEALLIPRQLQAWGVTVSEATTIYGQYAGIAFTLIYLPMVITVALAIAMVPAIAEARAIGDFELLNKRCRQALKLTIYSSLPFAIAFYLFASPICNLVFATPGAGIPLKILAWGCIFIYLEQTTVGILNGLGAMPTILWTTLAGGIVDLLGIYYLTPIMGITGAALGVNLGAALTAILNLLALARLTGFRLDFRTFIYWPAVAGAGMFLGASLLWVLLAAAPDLWRLLQSLAGSGLLYLLILLGGGEITPAHFYLFPWPGHRNGK
ncbi:putative polysaccharide biosynthesis protein [Moorella sp. Hama-1]|uniref:putative polysaccharide biosynthesis protein n=1 Tax=Moorella sp. Hama-1 TaxID=2138101 RepID=UPI000D658829|nr:polysaccharide biosynthesis protein [Moorella sp. Hama-1]BCV21228.1 polysaccharide biosynthesis protein [Moorella sp. Hama-1]